MRWSLGFVVILCVGLVSIGSAQSNSRRNRGPTTPAGESQLLNGVVLKRIGQDYLVREYDFATGTSGDTVSLEIAKDVSVGYTGSAEAARSPAPGDSVWAQGSVVSPGQFLASEVSFAGG